MKNEFVAGYSRRDVLFLGSALLALSAFDLRSVLAQGAGGSLKIGIVGSGKLGGTVGTLWAKAGHQVFFSSRHPEELKDLVQAAGPNARAGTVQEAVAFGDVLL